MNEIQEKIKELQIKESKVPELLKSTIKIFEEFEKEAINDFTSDDPLKYVINSSSCVNTKKVYKHYKSPYEHLSDKIHNDIMDLETMLDSYNTVVELGKTVEKSNGTEDYATMKEFLNYVTYCFKLESQKFQKFLLDEYHKELTAIKDIIMNNTESMNIFGLKILANNNLVNIS